MTLSFADATRALAQVSASSREFQDACMDQIRDTQLELDGIDSALRSILAHHTHLKLPDNSYLYLKNCQSMRALNETRIAKAVDALSVKQYEALLQDDASKSWSPTRVLCEALADNLDAECVVHTTAPTICKKPPATTTNAVWRAAPPAVAAHAKRFTELHEKLSVMRKHRSAGKKRAASVQAVAEPIVQAYLENHKVSRQLIQFGGTPAPPAPSLPALPEIPEVMASQGITTQGMGSQGMGSQGMGSQGMVAEPTIVQNATGTLNGQRVMFVTRTYTSRGKAPKLNSFVDALPQGMAIFAKDSFANLMSRKTEILKVMLEMYSQQYQTDQGSVKKRLIVKPVL